MITKFLNALDRPGIRAVRSTLCFVIAFFMFGLVVSGMMQTRNADDRVITEVHFTQLDDAVKNLQESVRAIKDDAKENRFYHWLELAGMSGLLGEMGVRLGRKAGGSKES